METKEEQALIQTWGYLTLKLVKIKLQELYNEDVFNPKHNITGGFLSIDACKAIKLIDELIVEYQI